MDEIGNGAVESMEKLNSLRITSLDDDDIPDDEELQQEDYDTDDDDEDEESDESVTLGFVEKPKNSWSLLRQLFPSKAGGVPVCRHSPYTFNFSFILLLINFLLEFQCCFSFS